MQRWVQRALIDLQHVLGDLLDAFRDRPAVERLGLQRPKDQQVEGAGKKIWNDMSRHRVSTQSFLRIVLGSIRAARSVGTDTAMTHAVAMITALAAYATGSKILMVPPMSEAAGVA